MHGIIIIIFVHRLYVSLFSALEQTWADSSRLEQTRADLSRLEQTWADSSESRMWFRMSESYPFCSAYFGKIQGDGRKYLDPFKSYFGSQISSQSLNEIHICRLQPKSATKDDFFHIFLSLVVSSSRRMLPFDVWPSFPVTTWTLQRERFLSADFGKTIVPTTEGSQTAIFSVHFPWFLIAVACLTRPLT